MRAARRYGALLSLGVTIGIVTGCTQGGGREWDGQVRNWGTLRAMFHDGVTGATVSLDSLLPDPELHALGALADLAGEVTIVGGRAWLSRPSEAGATAETTRVAGDGATLLVASRVPAWQSVRIDRSIPFEELDDRIAALAAASGLDTTGRIPFLGVGRLENLAWHVVDGRRLTVEATSHLDHLAASNRDSLAVATGVLVGFYSEHDERVFTHMGSRTHLHCALESPLAAGHVDHVAIPAGAELRFPRVARGVAGIGS